MKKKNDYRELYDRTKQWHDTMNAYVIDIGCRDLSSSNVRPFIEEDYKALLIEPNPPQVDVIEEELDRKFYEYQHNIKLVPVAITEENGITEFISSPNIGHSRIPNEDFDRNKWQTKGQKKIFVEGYTWQTILNSYQEFMDAAIIDIDTEGMDYMIAKQILEAGCRPMFILIEHWGDSSIFTKQWELFTSYHYAEIGIELPQSSLWKLVL